MKRYTIYQTSDGRVLSTSESLTDMPPPTLSDGEAYVEKLPPALGDASVSDYVYSTKTKRFRRDALPPSDEDLEQESYLLREKASHLLEQTDFLLLPDVSISRYVGATTLEQIKQYRQQLRDYDWRARGDLPAPPLGMRNYIAENSK